VQPELPLQQPQLGLVRLVDADPDEVAGLATHPPLSSSGMSRTLRPAS
jgi:hypothetical protein